MVPGPISVLPEEPQPHQARRSFVHVGQMLSKEETDFGQVRHNAAKLSVLRRSALLPLSSCYSCNIHAPFRSVEKELKRLVEALKVVRSAVDVPISVDTKRSEVAEAGLENGGDMINDVGGMISDPRMAELCSNADVPAVVLAQNIIQLEDPVEAVIRSLEKSLSIASEYRLNDLLIDPAIGFFRNENSDFLKRDLSILNGLHRLRMMGLPICLGISRKSFIGKVLNLKDPNDRLQGSLGATSIAVYNGAHMVRTHDISETIDAVRIAEALRSEGWDSQRQE